MPSGPQPGSPRRPDTTLVPARGNHRRRRRPHRGPAVAARRASPAAGLGRRRDRAGGRTAAERPHPARFGELIEASAPPDEPRVETTVAVAADAMEGASRCSATLGARYRLADQLPNRAVTLRLLALERIACPAPSRARRGRRHRRRRHLPRRAPRRPGALRRARRRARRGDRGGHAADRAAGRAARAASPAGCGGRRAGRRLRAPCSRTGRRRAGASPAATCSATRCPCASRTPTRSPRARASTPGPTDASCAPPAPAGSSWARAPSPCTRPSASESLDPRDGELMVHGSLAIEDR